MLTWRTKEREKKKKREESVEKGRSRSAGDRKKGGGWKKREREINSSAATRECYSYHNFLLSAIYWHTIIKMHQFCQSLSG